jgi:hypothetical protein
MLFNICKFLFRKQFKEGLEIGVIMGKKISNSKNKNKKKRK